MAGTLPAALTLGTMPTTSPATGPQRRLRTIEVPPGIAAVDALWEPLDQALSGGEPIALLASVSEAYPAPMVDALRNALRPDESTRTDTALVVTTSGSTGNPRGVELTASAVDAMTDQINSRVGNDPSWVLAIPATSIGGLNVLIRSRRIGRPPTAVRSLGGAERFTDTVFAEAIDAAGDLGSDIAVSLVPAQLPRLLSSQLGREALARCALILVGGAALTPQAARDAAEAGITITTTYGMTETSGGCVLDGHPLEDVRIRIDDTDDRIWIAGPMLASGYRDGLSGNVVDGWLRTNDRGRWAAGALQVLGRLDDIVTVNGVNVDILAVEDRLRDHPSVADALALAVSQDESDATVYAAVISDPTAPTPPDSEQLRDWVREQLGREATPSSIHRVERFPLTSTGKVDRIAIARLLGIDEGDAGSVGGDLL